MKEMEQLNEKQFSAFDCCVAKIVGRIESDLERFAASIGVSPAHLTRRVAEQLYPDTGGKILGVQESVPPMRRSSSKGHEKRRTKVAVADRPRRGAPKARTSGSGSYWDKMSAQERREEMARRQKVRHQKAKQATKQAA